ncbi:MAG: hypothetical protein LQ337_003868 [Flavoplaca oasis]|nr:MAG: hypothetical protein LQ337_003868 [Flavoplaca oasis]
MAGIQERLRQMGNINSDLIEQDKRLVRKMDRAIGSDWSPRPLALEYRHVKAPPDVLEDKENIPNHDQDEVSW